LVWVLLVLVVVGPACAGKRRPSLTPEVATLIDKARARPIPPQLQARFQIRLRSKPLELSGTTGGGLQVARPGTGRIEIFAPFGGSLLTLLSDGTAIAALSPRDQKHYHAADAEALVREATGGAAGIDDILAVLVGDLPFDDAKVVSAVGTEEGYVRAEFAGPDGIRVEVDLDPQAATLVRLVARDPKQSVLLDARYEGWATLDGQLVPEKVEVSVPVVDLEIGIRYQAWSRPDKLMDYGTAAPDGFTTESLVEVVRRNAAALQEGARQP
jgi:hypothetical protein